ncbi:MAG: class I SAM-dependent methyltransferase [Chromatiales bacterium]|nr:class I SAM-dependent methyltransferase [Chromatiales bacterium]
MSARADMHRHFTEVSPVYRSVRTTDPEPVERIARELDGLAGPKGADIGCGAGRYVLLMFRTIPNLSLTCVDTTPAMLEQVEGLLRANGIDRFETRQSTAECLELQPGGYDFVSSFNAVHHFDIREFLRRSRDGLVREGRLFVYTRLPEHNARSIWGRYFPGFAQRETRLLTLGDLHGAIEGTPGLRFAGAACLRYRRRAPLERLIEQARNRHYSTFALYEPDEFEDALATFRAAVERRHPELVDWHDENILIQAVRDDD